MSLLVIHVSPRTERSHSRKVANALIEKLDSSATIYELTSNPPPFLTDNQIAYTYGFYKEEDLTWDDKKSVDYQNQAIADLKKADTLIISTPRWNFGVPAVLKAWFDQIIAKDQTVNIKSKYVFEWLVTNIKKAYVITASGGPVKLFGIIPVPGQILAEKSIRKMLSFIGIKHIEFIRVEWTGNGNGRTEAIIASLSK